MTILLLILLYPCIHLLCYTLFLRRLEVFKKEKVIFLWHVLSFLLLCGSILIAILSGVTLLDYPIDIIALAIGIGIHGVYSLSFLELWSITQIGYSLAIIMDIGDAGECGMPQEQMPNYKAVGDKKRQERIVSLKALKLIEETSSGSLKGTTTGKLIGNFFKMLYFVLSIKSLN